MENNELLEYLKERIEISETYLEDDDNTMCMTLTEHEEIIIDELNIIIDMINIKLWKNGMMR